MPLDTLAEVQRLCNFVASTKANFAHYQEQITKVNVQNKSGWQLVRDNGEGFTIHTDGIHYIVTDGHIQSLYKTR